MFEPVAFNEQARIEHALASAHDESVDKVATAQSRMFGTPALLDWNSGPPKNEDVDLTLARNGRREFIERQNQPIQLREARDSPLRRLIRQNNDVIEVRIH